MFVIMDVVAKQFGFAGPKHSFKWQFRRLFCFAECLLCGWALLSVLSHREKMEIAMANGSQRLPRNSPNGAF